MDPPKQTNPTRIALIGAFATVAAALIGLYGVLHRSSPPASSGTTVVATPAGSGIDAIPTTDIVFLVDSGARREVLKTLESILDGSGISAEFDSKPISEEWLQECSKMEKKHPALIIAHFHALRGVMKGNDAKFEEALLAGLHQIASNQNRTKFVLYSRSFTLNSAYGDSRISTAIDRLIKSDASQRSAYENLRSRIKTIRWPQHPQQTDRGKMIDLVREMLK